MSTAVVRSGAPRSAHMRPRSANAASCAIGPPGGGAPGDAGSHRASQCSGASGACNAGARQCAPGSHATSSPAARAAAASPNCAAAPARKSHDSTDAARRIAAVATAESCATLPIPHACTNRCGSQSASKLLRQRSGNAQGRPSGEAEVGANSATTAVRASSATALGGGEAMTASVEARVSGARSSQARLSRSACADRSVARAAGGAEGARASASARAASRSDGVSRVQSRTQTARSVAAACVEGA